MIYYRSKHIEIKYHFSRNVRKNQGLIQIKFVPTDKNAVDILVKCLMKDKHSNRVQLLIF